MNKRNAMTLLELVVVVVVLGIVVGIAVPTYTKAINQAKAKEAKSNLRAIYAAQKNYYMKNGAYYVNTSETEINKNLFLDLEFGTWDYSAGVDPLGTAFIVINGTTCYCYVKDTPPANPGEPYCDTSPAVCANLN